MAISFSNVMKAILGINPKSGVKNLPPKRIRSSNIAGNLVVATAKADLKSISSAQNQVTIFFPVPINASDIEYTFMSESAIPQDSISVFLYGKKKYTDEFEEIAPIIESMSAFEAGIAKVYHRFAETMYQHCISSESRKEKFEPYKDDTTLFIGVKFLTGTAIADTDKYLHLLLMYAQGSPSAMPLAEIAS